MLGLLTQLLDVRKQLELELKQFTTMFGQLKLAQTRFQGCLDSVEKIRPENQGACTHAVLTTEKVSLLPLTASLYVPGRLSDPDTVIVDVGTGYYVEKSREDAKKLYKDKIAYVTKNLEQLQETIHRKQDNVRVVGEVMQVVRDAAYAESDPAARNQVIVRCRATTHKP